MIVWPDGSKTRPPISSPFGPRNLKNPLASKNHLGVDMYGFETVHSIADGEVVYVGWNGGVGWSPVAGYMVWVQHDGFFSRYLHCAASTARVSTGQKVKAGQALIDMGWSGLANSWDEHVHMEITPGRWHTGNYGQVDPVPFIEARLGAAGGGGGEDVMNKEQEKKLDEVLAFARWYQKRDGGSTDPKYGVPTYAETSKQVESISKRIAVRENGASIGSTFDGVVEILHAQTALLEAIRQTLGRSKDRVEDGDTLGVSLDRVSKQQGRLIELFEGPVGAIE